MPIMEGKRKGVRYQEMYKKARLKRILQRETTGKNEAQES